MQPESKGKLGRSKKEKEEEPVGPSLDPTAALIQIFQSLLDQRVAGGDMLQVEPEKKKKKKEKKTTRRKK